MLKRPIVLLLRKFHHQQTLIVRTSQRLYRSASISTTNTTTSTTSSKATYDDDSVGGSSDAKKRGSAHQNFFTFDKPKRSFDKSVNLGNTVELPVPTDDKYSTHHLYTHRPKLRETLSSPVNWWNKTPADDVEDDDDRERSWTDRRLEGDTNKAVVKKGDVSAVTTWFNRTFAPNSDAETISNITVKNFASRGSWREDNESLRTFIKRGEAMPLIGAGEEESDGSGRGKSSVGNTWTTVGSLIPFRTPSPSISQRLTLRKMKKHLDGEVVSSSYFRMTTPERTVETNFTSSAVPPVLLVMLEKLKKLSFTPDVIPEVRPITRLPMDVKVDGPDTVDKGQDEGKSRNKPWVSDSSRWFRTKK